jgi:hypothetical protein
VRSPLTATATRALDAEVGVQAALSAFASLSRRVNGSRSANVLWVGFGYEPMDRLKTGLEMISDAPRA